MSLRVLFAVGAILSGCASYPGHSGPELSSDDIAQLDAALECRVGPECDALWRRAQVWIASNAGYKIQVATDAVIETYNATSWSTVWAFRLTREPIGGGRERFNLIPSCGPSPLCRRTDLQLIAAFRRYLRTAL